MLPGRWLSAVIPVDLFAMQTTVGLQLPLRWEHSTNAHVSNCGTSTSFTHVTIATWNWYEYCWSVCKMVYLCVCLRNKQSCWDQRRAVRSLKRFFYKMQTCSVVQAWSNKLICSNSDIAELLMWPGWVHPTNFPCVCVFSFVLLPLLPSLVTSLFHWCSPCRLLFFGLHIALSNED